jgi:hypothetical protein
MVAPAARTPHHRALSCFPGSILHGEDMWGQDLSKKIHSIKSNYKTNSKLNSNL